MKEVADGERTHRIPPEFRRQSWLSAVGLGVVAVGALLMLWQDPPWPDGALLIPSLALLFGLGAAWSVRLALTLDRMTVTVGRDGLRVGGGEWVEWGAVGRIRERPGLQRLELLGHAGQRLASIEYQVEGAAEIIDQVARRIPPPESGALSRRFGHRWSGGYVLTSALTCGGICALGVLLWWRWGLWPGLCLLPVLAWALHSDLRDQLRELELGAEGLVLRTSLRERLVPRHEVRRASLTLVPVRQGQRLTSAVVLGDGTVERVSPVGQDALAVHAAVKEWLAMGPMSRSSAGAAEKP